MLFPNKVQMIGLVHTAFCPSAFLQSILFPHLFPFLFLAVMCHLHTVAIAVHNALFQSNKLVMESRIKSIKQIPSIRPLAWAGFSAVLPVS